MPPAPAPPGTEWQDTSILLVVGKVIHHAYFLLHPRPQSNGTATGATAARVVQVASAVVSSSQDGLSASAERSVRAVVDGIQLEGPGTHALSQSLLGITTRVWASSVERATLGGASDHARALALEDMGRWGIHQCAP